ncbi:FMAR-like protein, partial [Mya arenaria]
MSSEIASLLWQIVAPVLFLLGTVGNILSILVLTRPSSRKSSTATYLTALAVSDLIVLFFIFASTELSSWLLVAVTCERIISTMWPHKVRVLCTRRSAFYVILSLVVTIYGGTSHILFGMHLGSVMVEEHGFNNHTQFPNSTSIVKAFLNSTESGVSNSSFSQNKITDLNRFLATTQGHSTTSNDIHSSFATITTLNIDASATMSTESFTKVSFHNMSSPPIPSVEATHTQNRYVIQTTCSPLKDHSYADFFNFIYPWVDLLMYFLIPAVILVIGDIIIIRKIIESRTLRKLMLHIDSSARKLHDKSASVTMMLLTVNAVFVLCTTPISIFLIGMPYWVDSAQGFTSVQAIGWAIVNLLMYLNHAINFILYFLSGTKFRQKVMDMFYRKKIQRAQSLSLSQRESNSDGCSPHLMAASFSQCRKDSQRSSYSTKRLCNAEQSSCNDSILK